jgi:hypothetical protein
MNDSQKLDQILQILNKHQLETYIPTKWKPIIDYCEQEELRPERVLELLIMAVGMSNHMNRKEKEREANKG